jgi:hypothetical protein
MRSSLPVAAAGSSPSPMNLYPYKLASAGGIDTFARHQAQQGGGISQRLLFKSQRIGLWPGFTIAGFALELV